MTSIRDFVIQRTQHAGQCVRDAECSCIRVDASPRNDPSRRSYIGRNIAFSFAPLLALPKTPLEPAIS